MTGIERLEEMMEGQEDSALKEVVNYLISRKDLEKHYLNEEKNLTDMCSFIKNRGMIHTKNGWNFVSNEVVFSWAVMYFSLPNSFLKFKPSKKSKEISNNAKTNKNNNIITLEKAKEKHNINKQTEQLTLFGGTNDETRKN